MDVRSPCIFSSQCVSTLLADLYWRRVLRRPVHPILRSVVLPVLPSCAATSPRPPADAVLNSNLGVPLRGAAIGNGWIDAEHQYPAYLDYAVKHGLVTQGSTVRNDAPLLPTHITCLSVGRNMTRRRRQQTSAWARSSRRTVSCPYTSTFASRCSARSRAWTPAPCTHLPPRARHPSD
jgi:hypothetical protein